MKKIIVIIFTLVVIIVGIVIASKDLNVAWQDISSNEVNEEQDISATFESGDGKVYNLYKQYDSKWANEKYWGKNMKKKGCGITGMAIVLSGYGETDTPLELQKRYQPVMNYENMSKELETHYNIKSSGFFYDEESLSEEKILSHLKEHKPMIACAWAKNGINRWTKSSHYLVLLDADSEENIYVANPGGSDFGPNKNGWYHASEVIPHLAKALFVEGK